MKHLFSFAIVSVIVYFFLPSFIGGLDSVSTQYHIQRYGGLDSKPSMASRVRAAQAERTNERTKAMAWAIAPYAIGAILSTLLLHRMFRKPPMPDWMIRKAARLNCCTERSLNRGR